MNYMLGGRRRRHTPKTWVGAKSFFAYSAAPPHQDVCVAVGHPHSHSHTAKVYTNTRNCAREMRNIAFI